METTFRKSLPDGRTIDAVLVNGIVYEVLSIKNDAQGKLLCIRRPNGRRSYAARPIEDQSYGSCRAWIVCRLGL